MSTFLRKSIGSWSAGTRVEVLTYPDESGYATIRVLAGDRPVIDVEIDYLVERGVRRAKMGEISEDSGGT